MKSRQFARPRPSGCSHQHARARSLARSVQRQRGQEGTTRVCVMRRLRPVEGERGPQQASEQARPMDGRTREGGKETGGQTERQSYAMLNGKWMRRRWRRRRRRRKEAEGEGHRGREGRCLRLLDGSTEGERKGEGAKQKAIRGNEVWGPTTT